VLGFQSTDVSVLLHIFCLQRNRGWSIPGPSIPGWARRRIQRQADVRCLQAYQCNISLLWGPGSRLASILSKAAMPWIPETRSSGVIFSLCQWRFGRFRKFCLETNVSYERRVYFLLSINQHILHHMALTALQAVLARTWTFSTQRGQIPALMSQTSVRLKYILDIQSLSPRVQSMTLQAIRTQ